MIIISNQYLHLFKKFNKSLNYMIKPGVWLSFDENTHEYIGIEMFYMCGKTEIEESHLLNTLIARNILEIK